MFILRSICLLLVFVGSVSYSKEIQIDTLSAELFLGQVYPSGNMYLKSFKENVKQWPKSLNYTGIGKSKKMKKIGAIRSATFSKVLGEVVDQKTHTLKAIFIPNQEQMEDNHDDCGFGKKKRNRKYAYKEGPDFFESIIDQCDSTDGVAVYESKGDGKISYNVLAYAPSLGTVEIKPLSKSKRKPTPSEQKEIKAAKARVKKQDAEFGCSTNAAFLDEAIELYLFKFSKTLTEAKLSTYSTPGCAGHLAFIYVLDTIKQGKILYTETIVNYVGVL